MYNKALNIMDYSVCSLLSCGQDSVDDYNANCNTCDALALPCSPISAKKIKPDDYASNIPGKDTSIILLSPDRLIRHAGKLPLSLIHRQDFMQILMQISSVDHVTWDVTKTIVSHATGGTTCPDNEI